MPIASKHDRAEDDARQIHGVMWGTAGISAPRNPSLTYVIGLPAVITWNQRSRERDGHGSGAAGEEERREDE